ncbi:MAG TPA: caspase family protein [Blastocatellia bacterium]|nr:caspase family protein [Blastocatellia bacterium]
MSSSQKIAAFLVGINRYPDHPLRGCTADTGALYEWLARNRGLKPDSTQILFDGAATRANILRRLDWLSKQRVDVAIFAFSGHGTRVQDLDADETTGFDQAIVPVDYDRAGLILDDDLRRAYDAFPATTRLIVHLDSCYSDRADRGLIAAAKDYLKRRTPRFLPPELVSGEALAQTYQTRRWRGFGPQERDAVSKRILSLAGCRDFETSADAWFGQKVGYRGAFTHHLLRAQQILGAKADTLAIIEETRRTLAAGKFSQVPQLSGPPEWMRRPLFS